MSRGARGGRRERTVFDLLAAGVLLEQFLDGAFDDFDSLPRSGLARV